MKYCPFCGAELLDGAVSFCSECGKQIQKSEASGPAKAPKEKKARKREKKKKAPKPHKKKEKKTKDIPEVMGESVDDCYDGYYNDVLPPDTDRVKDGMDKELVKKIVALCVGVSVIIFMCVALLYIL